MEAVLQGGVLEEAIRFFARIKQRKGKRLKSHSPPSEHMLSDPKPPIACYLLILPTFTFEQSSHSENLLGLEALLP